MGELWSPSARSIWGKTDRQVGASLPLVQHLEDASGVASHLWDYWIPPAVAARLSRSVGGKDEARMLLVWLAGTHDVGKATPAFAHMARDVGMGGLVDAMSRAGLSSTTLPRAERLHHSLTGQAIVHQWLAEAHGYKPARAQALASVTGAHHGAPPRESQLAAVRRTRALGGPAWHTVQTELLEVMTQITGVQPVLEAIRERKLSLPTLIDLSALVIVADWLASDADIFPYDLSKSSAERLEAARAHFDLPLPWHPEPVTDVNSLFADRFPHMGGAHPSAVQTAAVECAMNATEPPMVIIEAPTGSGKTEAALMCAETLVARFGAGGVFVALPTMATSNAMFGRVLRWVHTWDDTGDPTLWLAHGKAELNEDFAGLLRERAIRGVHDDDHVGAGAPRVSTWLTGRKKGLLATVVVGTIDQVLMGALQARHLALRHLALSSKVVVVDEVHAADTHMRSFLVRMLDYLGSYGTPVVLLSATLPPSQRVELITAYQTGRLRAGNGPGPGLTTRRLRGAAPAAPAAGPGPEQYPLITAIGATVSSTALPFGGTVRDVHLERLEDDLNTLMAELRAELSGGGCVAVVRNTVRRAQETFDVLREEFGEDVKLFHSRFLACDRAVRERALAELLGPSGDRPERLIVVGTQVLEQSLDIDVDLMVCDAAPVDLVVQRLGRLHRHTRPRPTGLAAPRCLLVGVEWDGERPVPVVASTWVYAESLLLRALAVLCPFLDGEVLSLPQRGPGLVHAAYDPELPAPAGWEEPWEHADNDLREQEATSRARAASFQIAELGTATSLVGWTNSPADDQHEEVGRAQVRDSEDGIDVIVIRRDQDGQLHSLDGGFTHAGRPIPYQPDDRDGLTKHLASCTVALPRALTQPWMWEATIAELEKFLEGDRWQGSRWLRGQLPLVLDDALTCELNGYRISYSPQRGLDATPKDRNP